MSLNGASNSFLSSGIDFNNSNLQNTSENSSYRYLFDRALTGVPALKTGNTDSPAASHRPELLASLFPDRFIGREVLHALKHQDNPVFFRQLLESASDKAIIAALNFLNKRARQDESNIILSALPPGRVQRLGLSALSKAEKAEILAAEMADFGNKVEQEFKKAPVETDTGIREIEVLRPFGKLLDPFRIRIRTSLTLFKLGRIRGEMSSDSWDYWYTGLVNVADALKNGDETRLQLGMKLIQNALGIKVSTKLPPPRFSEWLLGTGMGYKTIKMNRAKNIENGSVIPGSQGMYRLNISAIDGLKVQGVNSLEPVYVLNEPLEGLKLREIPFGTPTGELLKFLLVPRLKIRARKEKEEHTLPAGTLLPASLVQLLEKGLSNPVVSQAESKPGKANTESLFRIRIANPKLPKEWRNLTDAAVPAHDPERIHTLMLIANWGFGDIFDIRFDVMLRRNEPNDKPDPKQVLQQRRDGRIGILTPGTVLLDGKRTELSIIQPQKNGLLRYIPLDMPGSQNGNKPEQHGVIVMKEPLEGVQIPGVAVIPEVASRLLRGGPVRVGNEQQASDRQVLFQWLERRQAMQPTESLHHSINTLLRQDIIDGAWQKEKPLKGLRKQALINIIARTVEVHADAITTVQTDTPENQSRAHHDGANHPNNGSSPITDNLSWGMPLEISENQRFVTQWEKLKETGENATNLTSEPDTHPGYTRININPFGHNTPRNDGFFPKPLYIPDLNSRVPEKPAEVEPGITPQTVQTVQEEAGSGERPLPGKTPVGLPLPHTEITPDAPDQDHQPLSTPTEIGAGSDTIKEKPELPAAPLEVVLPKDAVTDTSEPAGNNESSIITLKIKLYRELPEAIRARITQEEFISLDINKIDLAAGYEAYMNLHPDVRDENGNARYSLLEYLSFPHEMQAQIHSWSAQAKLTDKKVKTYKVQAEAYKQHALDLTKATAQIKRMTEQVQQQVISEPQKIKISVQPVLLDSYAKPAVYIGDGSATQINRIKSHSIAGNATRAIRNSANGSYSQNAVEIQQISLKGKIGSLPRQYPHAESVPAYLYAGTPSGQVALYVVVNKLGVEPKLLQIPAFLFPVKTGVNTSFYDIDSRQWKNLPQINSSQQTQIDAYAASHIDNLSSGGFYPIGSPTGIPGGAPVNVPVPVP